MEKKREAAAAELLSIQIYEKLSSFSTVSSSGCSICRVPNPLRQINEKAYEPHIISIGPYHHGKDHLKGMEVHKMHCLERLLQRGRETSLQRYVMALKGMEDEIRKCYAEPLDHIGGDALVEMMLLDGCFIIELISCGNQTRKIRELREKNDDFRNFNVVSVIRDLLLVENQLPFFVLLKLFDMSTLENAIYDEEEENDKEFIHRSLDFFSGMIPGPGIQNSIIVSSKIQNSMAPDPEIQNFLKIYAQDIKNLLNLVRVSWLPSPEARLNYKKYSAVYSEWNLTRNATELQEAGIKFKKMNEDEEKSLFDIEFKDGVLWIPTIRMEENTDTILRNLIAHEQCCCDCPRYVTDYVTFMNCLINTGKDVELLRRSGAIVNGLGDDEVVATIFNRLCHSIELSEKNFYSEIFINVRKHCDRKWRVWMAYLRHNYFTTPWAMISFPAAVFLIILTAVQTIYLFHSYYRQ
ncbi:hypothetical protein SLEP1_g18669 [Rubroshorea leprosula]|uniref:Uncharacterized protein n=1 Tax=Rubroshorea leprosula TaxID=152421 RepID=A0AAV5IYD0_9ROSI|nr:hypothetical protein SLEP1_g18669 [Rubroshorea leprosula]